MTEVSPASSRHNHLTRDIKPRGKCPACDAYHDIQDASEALIERDKAMFGTSFVDILGNRIDPSKIEIPDE